MSEVKKFVVPENKSFEEFITETLDKSEEIVDRENKKEWMKLRDSGRVCFLENQKAFEKTGDEKYVVRARKYLNRYLVAKAALENINAAEQKLKEEQKKKEEQENVAV